MGGGIIEFDIEDIIAVLRYYGSDGVVVGNKQWRPVRCPFHDDRQASAGVSEGGGFVCHGGCDIKGDPISVVMKKEGIDFVGATRKFAEISGRSVDELRLPTERFSSRRVSNRRSRLDSVRSSIFPDWFLQ